jgi:HTH-type transcriptional regulator/antitoxin HigA
MTKKLYPCQFDWKPTPPGETLLETLEFRGISQKELAKRIGCPPKYINQIVAGLTPITPELALLLEQVTGSSAKFWNTLETNYQTRKVNWQAKERL